MGFLDFLLSPESYTFGRKESSTLETRSAIIPPPRVVSSGVTVTDALSISAVFRSVQIIATNVKSLTVKTFRDDVEIPAPLWIRQPDPKISPQAFYEQATISMALSGNAFLRVLRNTRGEPLQLEVLNPYDVQIETDNVGTVTGYVYRGTTKYALNDIQHLALLRVPGNAYGLGPIQAAQPELLNARDTRDYSANYWSMGIPSGILKTDQYLSNEDSLAAKADWNATAGAKNGTVVLSQGLTYQPMYLSPRDSMFIEAMEFSRTTIASLFGIPATYLLANAGNGSSLTYTNIQQEALSFIRGTLQVYTGEIEAALSQLLPRGVVARYNFDSILRTDTLSRYQAHEIALRSGFMTVDEVRQIENLGGIGN